MAYRLIPPDNKCQSQDHWENGRVNFFPAIKTKAVDKACGLGLGWGYQKNIELECQILDPETVKKCFKNVERRGPTMPKIT